jgi:CHAT domain-containing protein/Tfp pilus assembly protein PilF
MKVNLKYPVAVFSILLCVLTGRLAAAQGPTLRSQITQHEQKIAQARAINDKKDESIELNTLGSLYRQAGETQKSLDDLNQALQIEQAAGSRSSVALTQNLIGRVYTDLGQEQKALDIFNQILPVWREVGSRQGEASTLNNMGRVYNDLGQREKALDYLNRGLPLWRAVNNRNGEASTLDNLGTAYSDMGQGPKALDYFNQALPVWRETGERSGEALTLNNMAKTYADLGKMQKSLESYNKALAIWRETGNRQGEASTLNFMGRAYSGLGQKQQALEDYNQALPIWREVGNRSGEALAFNDIGRINEDTGKKKEALDFYNQALPIWREAGNRRGEATTLNNIGRDELDMGEKREALETNYRALFIWREVEDRRGEAFALSSISKVYHALGQPQYAFPNSLAALSLAKGAGDPDIEGGIETSMMIGFRDEHRPEEAILFGTEAVNSYQQIRKDISDLDKDMQAVFAQSKSYTYRQLAELLVETDRLGEAEKVLDLLKEQELKDIVRGTTQDTKAKVEPLRLTTGQQKAQSELDIPQRKALDIEKLSLDYAALLAKTSRTSAEEAQLKTLGESIQKGITEIFAYFKNTIDPELEQKPGAGIEKGSPIGEDFSQSYLQSALVKLGPGVIGVRLLLGERHAYAIVVTARTRKKFELKATPAELRSKAFEVLETLESPITDPRPRLEDLYAMIVAPIEGELKPLETSSAGQSGVPTLLWSLDDALRYLPMAALFDGHHYMVERFNNVLFTPESYGHMADSQLTDGPSPSVLAMGLSKSYGGLPALPGVMPELDAVVHDPAAPESHGPMEGRLLPNDQFTLAALKTELGPGKSYPVVHIASHFVVETSKGEEPYLMMGGEDIGDAKGYEWNLSDMENSAVAFHGTRLLTLSACSTAKDYKSRDGLEMDSLGMIAQQKEAEAVLATLWDVNDASTSRLMSDFYGRWLKHPADGKAEALRQAQLALLRGSFTSRNAASERGFQTRQDTTPGTHEIGYSHPFYWAPFVLIGNYR